MVRCHKNVNWGPRKWLREISSNQYNLSIIYLGGFEGKTVKLGNNKSHNWISGGLEKGNMHNPCHRAMHMSFINKYMVKSYSLLLWIHMYSSCLHIYDKCFCIFLYFLHVDISNDVQITFWHLSF